MHFYYDAQNKPSVALYDGVAYAYMYNLQGDVIALVNASGSKVVEYKYDAWGKPISKTGTLATTLGTLNPFRYRGYVYDEETGLYYLRSRYYNPTTCRFINSDCLAVWNLFAYCNNASVQKSDHSGAISDDEEWSLFDVYPDLFVEESPVTISESTSYFRKVIIPRIMSFVQDAKDYSYDKRGFKAAVYNKDGSLRRSGHSDCSHAMYEVCGKVGSVTSRYRYKGFKGEKGRIFTEDGTLAVELVEGMEVFSDSLTHVGMLLRYDFGDGEEWAVFQSTSEKITRSKALFNHDKGCGPNITSFYSIDGGLPNWVYYTAPQYIEE